MKKPAYFAIVVIMVFISIFVSGCKNTVAVPTDLSVNYDNYTLTWIGVDSVRNYIVEIKNIDNEKTDTVTSRRTNISLSGYEAGDYEIRIMAIAGDSSDKDSGWSMVYLFTKPYENGCIYKLINNNSEYQVTGAGSASGNITIQDYRGKPVTAIADGAFKGDGKIENIIIGNNVKSIGENAFYNCSKLQSVIIPESVGVIGTGAFQSCVSLKAITIPDNIAVINEYTFAYCESLIEVNLGSNVTTIMKSAFIDCVGLKSIVFPDSVKNIGDHAFSSNIVLTSVVFGSGLTTIGNYAFYRCFSLNNLVFGQNNHLSSVGEFVFSECTSLLKLSLPKGLINIGGGAFYLSTGLSEITIPDSVSGVGMGAFNGTKIYSDAIEAGLQYIYADRWLVGCTAELKATINEIDANTLKNNIVGIADLVFALCDELQIATFPASLKYIGSYSFSGNAKLWKIVTPDNSVEQIGERAFYGCAFLSNVILGKGLKTIGSYAFYGCTKLDNSNSLIPESVTVIGTYAFKNTALWGKPDQEGIVYAGKWVVGYNGIPMFPLLRADTVGISDYAFYKCETLGAISMYNAKYIGYAAFSGCTGLIIAGLSEDLVSIQDYTFYKCSSLYLINFPENLKSIGRSAFYKCEALNEIDLSESNVETIGDYAFYGCVSAESVKLGAHLKSIGNCAFYRCASITAIDTPDTLLTIGDRAFYKCELLETVTFGSNITSIGNYSFSGCAELISIVIPSSVRIIGNNAFYNCKAVLQLMLGNGVEKIGNYAFNGLEKITALVIPKSVVSIGNYAFKGCKALKYALLSDSTVQIGRHAFYGCKEMTVYTNASNTPDGWNTHWNSSYRPVLFGCVLFADYVDSIMINSILNIKASNGVAAPQRDNYVFMGWTTKRDGGAVEFSADDISNAPIGITLYAIWVKIATE